MSKGKLIRRFDPFEEGQGAAIRGEDREIPDDFDGDLSDEDMEEWFAGYDSQSPGKG